MTKDTALVFTLLVFLTATTAAGYQSETPSTGGHQKRGGGKARTAKHRVQSPLERSAEQIKQAHPEVSYATLYDDMAVVSEALPDVKSAFRKRGQSEREAERFALSGWKQLRGERLGAAEAMSTEAFVNYVVGLGTLVIKSTPTGASVELESKMQQERTMMVSYPSSGTYRIRLCLEGYECVEEECSVEAGRVTEFNRKLKPLNKKPAPQRRRNRP